MVSPFTNKREFHSFLLICLDHFYELFNFYPFYSLRFKLIILFFEIFSFRSCDVLFLPFNSFIFRLFFLCSPFCTFLFSILIIYYFSFCRREIACYIYPNYISKSNESNKIHYIRFEVNDISFKYSLIDRYFLYIYISIPANWKQVSTQIPTELPFLFPRRVSTTCKTQCRR